MATDTIDLLNHSVIPTSSDVFQATMVSQLTLANASGKELCFVLPAAATISADAGLEGSFRVPENFASGPTLVIRGVLDGAPTTLVIAFGAQMTPGADDESYDVALGTQDIASASSVSQVDEDHYEEVITLTNAGTFVIGDEVPWFFYIDDSVHTYTGLFLLKELLFKYTTV